MSSQLSTTSCSSMNHVTSTAGITARSVTFGCQQENDHHHHTTLPLCKIHEFDMVEEFERPLIWWSLSDFARFRSVCHKTVRMLRTTTTTTTIDNDDDDTSGDHQDDEEQQQHAALLPAFHQTTDDDSTTSNTKRDSDRQQEQEQQDTFYSLRGLENWGTKECQARRERIKKAVDVVLSSQNYSDAFVSAEAYQEATFHERIHAQARGAKDEEAVLWERMLEEQTEEEEEEEEQDADGDEQDDNYAVVTPSAYEKKSNDDDKTSTKKPSSSSRVAPLKRRRRSSSNGTTKNNKGGGKSTISGGTTSFGISLKNFARKISLPSAA